MEPTIAERVEITTEHLDACARGFHEIGNLVSACSQLLEIAQEQQAEINQLKAVNEAGDTRREIMEAW